ncbi:hypothetical protein PRtIB026_A39650 [Pseudomonas sp. RtIB026]|jgi:hypothetical protein|uniref:hypothetical protein n=1 Tax=Pseudomonas sp. RtIB026 TaxID=2749999 RepID=UPI0019404F6E|nr:hypothetical protein [Pseudomonas sp. RtIB026]BCJ06260.1 hypothetical protein PRtIB026_A39650 [Pseudomonas sp. RtIB026]
MSPLASALVSGAQGALIALPTHSDQDAAEFQASLVEHQTREQVSSELTQQTRLQVLAMAMDLLNDSFTVEGGS